MHVFCNFCIGGFQTTALCTEELAHLEMVGTIVHQLTDGVCPEELEKAGLGAYYTDHGVDIYPSSAAGVPFTASYDAVMLRRMMKT